MADALDINALIKQAEAAGAAKDTASKVSSAKAKLGKGQWSDQVINVFGIDKRLPSGFVNAVYGADGALVGYVKNGQVMPLIQPKEATTKSKRPSIVPPDSKITDAQTASFNYAQTLQQTAETEYNDLKVQAEIISRGGATPQQKQDFERAAKTYKSTVDAIQGAYVKSGAVQGDVNIDATGKLPEGTTYVDPSKPEAGPQKVAVGGTVAPVPTTTTGQTGQVATGTIAGINAPATPTGKQISQGTGTGNQGTTTSAGSFIPVLPGTSTKTTAPMTPDEMKQDFVNKYGSTAALILSVPELGDLFTKAMTSAQPMTQSEWDIAYKKSNWFNSTLAPRRDYEVARVSDSGSFTDQYNQLLQQFQNVARSIGVDPSVFGAAITPDQASQFSKTVDMSNPVAFFLTQHYNKPADATTIQNYVANHANIAKNAGGTLEGSIGKTVNDLKAYASSMGVASLYLRSSNGKPVADGSDYFQNAAQAIAGGTSDLTAEQEYIKQQAKAIYKPFADRIDKGQTVAALANPYTSALSNLLENIDPTNPTAIDLGSTTGYGALVTKALQGDGTNPMSLDQFATQVKQLPEWLQTGNARNSMMDTANQLLRSFGMVV